MGVFFWLWFGELMFFLKIVGFILGFVGVVVISAVGFGGYIFIVGIFLVLGFVVSWVFGMVFMKRMGGCVDFIWMVVF